MSTSEHAILTPGERVGSYEAVRRVGSGGMGEVWEARHSALKKRVALKILLPEHARSLEVTARFLREGEAASRIRHPHAVEVFDVGAHRGLPYLVMELLEGRDLDQWLHEDGVLSVEAAADILAPVVAAIAAAHDEGVIHRDLKPGNIHLSVTRDGVLVPKVLDFGISRVDGSGDVRTASAAVLGTPMYMSPEQTRGASDATAASDQYALGVILYECVTGRPPFDAPTVFGLLARIGSGEYTAPSALRPDLPRAFETVITRAMSLDPAKRYPTTRALGLALLPFASEPVRRHWQPVFEGRRSSPSAASPPPRETLSERRTTLGGAAHASSVAPREPSSRRSLVAVAALGVVMTAGALGWRAGARPEQDRYDVDLIVEPSSATVTLDGAALANGNYHGAYLRDGNAHHLSVNAPGCRGRDLIFVDTAPPPVVLECNAAAPPAPPPSAPPVVVPPVVLPPAPTVAAPTAPSPTAPQPAPTEPVEEALGSHRSARRDHTSRHRPRHEARPREPVAVEVLPPPLRNSQGPRSQMGEY